MARLRSGVGGSVCIGAIAALPPELIPRLLARAARTGEGPSVVVRAAPSGRNPAELLDGAAYDIVLVRGAADAPGLTTVVVAREAIGVALPADHPLAARPAIRPADLNGIPLISFGRTIDPTEFDRIYTALSAAGLTDLRLVHESHAGAVDASLRLVEGGVGASLKLESEVATFSSPGVTWRPLQGIALDVVISAAWRPDRTTPALRRVVRLFEAG